MVLPLLAAAGEALAAFGVGSTVANLADDIPAIVSMIMKHGEASQEPPDQQQKRQQDIVAARDKLVAKMVQGGMPPEQATKQVNEQLAPALQQAQERSQGDQPEGGGGSIAGPLISAAVGLLPGVGALRGGMGAAKAAYAAAAGGPAALGKFGQIAKGLGAGQWSLMKSGVMGSPKTQMGMGEQAALNHLKGQAPQAPPNMAGQMEQTGQGMEPNFTMASAERGRGLPYTPPSGGYSEPPPPPNMAGMRESVGPDEGPRGFQMGGPPLLPYRPQQIGRPPMTPPNMGGSHDFVNLGSDPTMPPGVPHMGGERGFVMTPEVRRALMLLRQAENGGG
jgi:hypothetical protein